MPGRVGGNPGDNSGSAADLQCHSLMRKLEFGDLGVNHRALWRISHAELEHVGKSDLERLISLSDGSLEGSAWLF